MSRTPKQILQNDYLIARAKIIEVAAVLDRIDRAVEASSQVESKSIRTEADPIYTDPTYRKIQDAIAILEDSSGEKTRRIQELLSREYISAWMQKFNLP